MRTVNRAERTRAETLPLELTRKLADHVLADAVPSRCGDHRTL